MTRIPRKTLLETGLWIGFAIIGFVYTFEFDQDIETYAFDATGWPRAVLVFIVLAALAHLVQVWRDADLVRPGDSAGAEDQAPPFFRNWRLLAMLALPVIYAWLLAPIGFYALTPVFIFLFLVLAEEKRWKYLLGISFGLYAILVFVFGKLLYLSLPLGNVQMFYDFSNWVLTVIR